MPGLLRHDAVFVVTEEHNCPIHNVGDEFIIHGSKLNVDQYQGTCLFLMPTLLSVLKRRFSRSSRATSPSKVKKFECDGCSGLLRFEHKTFSTTQEKLRREAERWANNRIIQSFLSLLREMELFRSLNDNELRNLILKMGLLSHPSKSFIIKESERGFCFYVILSGSVIVRNDSWGILAELGPGEFFGEMSLISGEPTYLSVVSKTAVQLATLNSREFRHITTACQELLLFLCRTIALRSRKNIILPYSVQTRLQEHQTDPPVAIDSPQPPFQNKFLWRSNTGNSSRRRIDDPTIRKNFRIIRTIRLFESLNDANLEDLTLYMRLKEYPSGRSIIKSGDQVNAFYVILSGSAVTKDNREKITAEIGAGDFFDEISLLSGEPSYFSVYCTTAVKLAVLDAEEFNRAIKKYPDFLASLCRIFVAYSREALNRDLCITGELGEISSTDFFQMIHSSGQSGRINFSLDKGHAVILFNKGEIVHCDYNNEQAGKEAFFTLLAQQKGRFTQNSILSDEERTLEPLGDFMRLLMEGTQYLDEDEDRGVAE